MTYLPWCSNVTTISSHLLLLAWPSISFPPPPPPPSVSHHHHCRHSTTLVVVLTMLKPSHCHASHHCALVAISLPCHPSSTPMRKQVGWRPHGAPILQTRPVLYSAPPIPAGILRNPQEWDRNRTESTLCTLWLEEYQHFLITFMC